jgi:hypothetical protein
MSKQKIFLYTSEIASYIGQNKWDYITPFERLWKRCDKECYEQIIKDSKNVLTDLSNEIQTIDEKQTELQKDLESKKITKKQYNTVIKKLTQEKETVIDKKKEIEKNIDVIDLSQEQRITKILGNENVNVLKAADIETDNKKERIESLIDTMKLDDKEKKIIKRETESFINKTHGTHKEDSAIEIYEKRFNIKLDTSQTFYKTQIETKKESRFDWYIGGKVDGLYIDHVDPQKSHIIEVKNRTKGFFSTLREYEKTQVQLYLYMLDLKFAKLVEKYNEKIRITLIYRDDIYIEQILSYLQTFINAFEHKFLNIPTLKTQFVSMNEDLKKITLRKLYLNDINTQLNNYILQQQEDQACDIDDLD